MEQELEDLEVIDETNQRIQRTNAVYWLGFMVIVISALVIQLISAKTVAEAVIPLLFLPPIGAMFYFMRSGIYHRGGPFSNLDKLTKLDKWLLYGSAVWLGLIVIAALTLVAFGVLYMVMVA